ncbi:unnamed protein product [Closterium sp. NIES-53]
MRRKCETKVKSRSPGEFRWELCELPPGKKAISSKLIFRHKYGPDGELTHYKSRLVAKGFQHTKGKDFDKIFAPVGKGTTLRVMLGMAANRGWRIKQMDITTAFLNGIILEELYMLQPKGLDDGSGRVCRLKKAIYGLKQAPRAWYHKLEETLLAGGFKKIECDHSLFLLQEKEQFLMLLVYVDDILLFSKSSAMIEHVEEVLEMQFKCSKMGDVKYYLGMHVERDLDKGVLRLHQRKYCEGLAENYGLQDGGKPATPLPSGFTVEPCADEEVVGPPAQVPPTLAPPALTPPALEPPAPVALGSVGSPAPAPSTPPVLAAPVPRVRAPPGPVVAVPPVTPAPAATPAPPAPAPPAPPALELHSEGVRTEQITHAATAETVSAKHQQNLQTKLLCDAIICIHICLPPIMCSLLGVGKFVNITVDAAKWLGGAKPGWQVWPSWKQHPEAPHRQTPHPPTQNPQAQHPQSHHPKAHHPQSQHHQAQHPQAKNPQSQHAQTQHPLAPHPQTQHLEQHLSRQLPEQAQDQGEGVPETHLREQDPWAGGDLPEVDREQGRAARAGEVQSGRGRDGNRDPTRQM